MLVALYFFITNSMYMKVITDPYFDVCILFSRFILLCDTKHLQKSNVLITRINKLEEELRNLKAKVAQPPKPDNQVNTLTPNPPPTEQPLHHQKVRGEFYTRDIPLSCEPGCLDHDWEVDKLPQATV